MANCWFASLHLISIYYINKITHSWKITFWWANRTCEFVCWLNNKYYNDSIRKKTNNIYWYIYLTIFVYTNPVADILTHNNPLIIRYFVLPLYFRYHFMTTYANVIIALCQTHIRLLFGSWCIVPYIYSMYCITLMEIRFVLKGAYTYSYISN